LEINVRDDRKIMEVWLTNQEKQDESLKEWLKNFYQQYREKKYIVAVYMSGEQDLMEETSALLCYNRKRLAEQEVRRKRVRTRQRAGAR
jgi:hypothetical protein